MTALVVAAALLVPAAVAWACVPNANVTVHPTSGPPGTQATVSGSGWANGPVRILWDQADGQVLAETRGPSFSGVPVTIPQSADGLRKIVAHRRFPDHDFWEFAMFEVRSAPPPSPSPGDPTPRASPPARRPGRCSRLRGRRRTACVRRSCGRLRGTKRRACVRKVTRRA